MKNGNGIGFDASGNVEVKAAQDGNIVVDTNGVSLSKTVSGLTSIGTETITASGAADEHRHGNHYGQRSSYGWQSYDNRGYQWR